MDYCNAISAHTGLAQSVAMSKTLETGSPTYSVFIVPIQICSRQLTQVLTRVRLHPHPMSSKQHSLPWTPAGSQSTPRVQTIVFTVQATPKGVKRVVLEAIRVAWRVQGTTVQHPLGTRARCHTAVGVPPRTCRCTVSTPAKPRGTQQVLFYLTSPQII